MSAHLQTTVNAGKEPIIGFDENKNLKGMSFFTPLFNAITSKKALMIQYKSYHSDTPVEEVIHPYYLKEYNQRWFLFALNEKYNAISNFALDRIESIEWTTAKFIPNTSIDFTHYFDQIVGVSVNHNEKVQTIMMRVNKEQLPYTSSKPLHHSQTVIERCEDGSAILSIEVIPNFELIQLLLSFGHRIEVLSPQSLREEILSRIKKSMEIYE